MVTNPRSWSLAMLLSAASANADTTLQFASQGDCPAFADSVQVSGALVRADIRTQGQDYSSIFDGSVNSLTTLLPAQHKYYQVRVDESAPDYTTGVANGTGNLIDEQTQKVQAMLQQQCTDQEKKGGSCDAMPDMRSVMQGIAASRAKMEMRDTGHKKTLAGVDCDVFEVLEDDVKKQEVCYALANELPISDDDRKGLALGLKVMGHVG